MKIASMKYCSGELITGLRSKAISIGKEGILPSRFFIQKECLTRCYMEDALLYVFLFMTKMDREFDIYGGNCSGHQAPQPEEKTEKQAADLAND
ncbi:hypothetical protein J45TS6_32560 [Paenibacillus sp. J45TS6]|nr:hypothetical protein J45TS6_32560 [Paenibacillus sp. J45TS6]